MTFAFTKLFSGLKVAYPAASAAPPILSQGRAQNPGTEKIVMEIMRESLRLRVLQAQRSPPMMLVTAGLIFMVFSLTVPPWRVAAWVIPMAGVWLINLPICRRAMKGLDKADIGVITSKQGDVRWMQCGNNIIIGLGMWWIGPGTSDHRIWFFTTILQCLYAFGALINSSTDPRAYIFGCFINLGLGAFFWAQSPTGLPIAGALLCLAALLARFSLQIKKDFDESIRMRFENEELLGKLGAEKMRVEAALATAEQASLAKSRFLAAASHDLRQPLHALILFAELLHNASPEQMTVFIGHIRKAANSLDKLFGGLIDLSRLDANAVQPAVAAVLLKPLIEALVEEHASLAQAKGLRLSCNCPNLAAQSDAFLLERVLRNLIDNAIKYSDRGEIEVRASSQGEEVIVTICDTGIGIEPAHQQVVFDEFFQLHNPLRQAEKGTGLGLAIVKRISDLLGHKLALTSQPGVGSEFSLLMKRTDVVSAPDRVMASTRFDAERLRGLHVFVIDDNATVRVAMQHMLDSWGCKSYIFDSLGSALANLDHAGVIPDALLVDYRLQEDFDGVEVISRLHKRLGATPAAIITGDIAIETSIGAVPENIPVFQKPVHPEEISAWLETNVLPLVEARARQN